MSNKGSDINVGSIEENIERCKELIKTEHSNWIGLSNQNAIKTLLDNLETLYFMQKSGNRKLEYEKQINEEHRKENGLLREKVKELEEENRIFALEGSKVRLASYIKENYIPRQKIKDKIEELKEEYDEILSEYGNLDTDVIINVPNKNVRKYLDKLVTKIQVLQELLQEEDK